MAFNPRPRTAARAQRAHSIISDSPFNTPPPAVRRRGGTTRAVRANTVDSDVSVATEAVPATRIPAHYSLPPTIPCPFAGTLEASLDAVLEWGIAYAGSQGVLDALLRPVSTATNWPVLLRRMYIEANDVAEGRARLESLLFLLTRTLLPEQIAENRALMARLYDRRKQLAIRLVLRYDMLREWKMDHTWHPIAIASLPPTKPPLRAPVPLTNSLARRNADSHIRPGRRALMPDIWATLIAAPAGGFSTHGVRERMRHHVTDLDAYLLISDEKAAEWSDETLLGLTSGIALQWQWLRQNNEILGEMEVGDYAELEGRADENEWIADDVRKPDWGRRFAQAKAVVEGVE